MIVRAFTPGELNVSPDRPIPAVVRMIMIAKPVAMDRYAIRLPKFVAAKRMKTARPIHIRNAFVLVCIVRLKIVESPAKAIRIAAIHPSHSVIRLPDHLRMDSVYRV
jgi:hypothetical protein